MNPTVGRIVHYFAPRYSIAPHLGSGVPDEVELLPAIIEKVHSESLVNLRILGGPEFGEKKTSVRFGDGEPNTWVWPPRA